MKRILFTGLFLSIVWMLTATAASAIHLGSFANHVYWYTMSDVYPDTDGGMFYQLGLTDADMLNRIDRPNGAEYMYSEPAFIPFQRMINFDDIGYTFAINVTNYDYWNQMVDHVLVDGNPMFICRNQGAIDVITYPMEWSFTDFYSGQGIDFKNYTIDNLLITIEDLQIKWFDYASEYYWSLTSIITVDGHRGQPSAPVPEPSTLLLFGTSLASLGYKFRRKKK
jgi:hypothetical protein